jgi:hypothetical protein
VTTFFFAFLFCDKEMALPFIKNFPTFTAHFNTDFV